MAPPGLSLVSIVVWFLALSNFDSATSLITGINICTHERERIHARRLSSSPKSNSCTYRSSFMNTRVQALASKQQLGEFETLDIEMDGDAQRYVRLYDFSTFDPLDYRCMWDMQKQLVDHHLERLLVEFKKMVPESQFCHVVEPESLSKSPPSSRSESGSNSKGKTDADHAVSILQKDERGRSRDSIILLQHNPVYTLGTGSDPAFIKLDEEKLAAAGIDLFRIERGGEVTYHGPGQLTVYPILDLRGYKQDIHWYMRALEEAILIALDSIGVHGATREDGLTGIWVENKKIAALGVKVKRWVTMHGLAVNVDSDSLGNFDGIVPCGLENKKVACINDFLDEPVTVAEFASHLKRALEKVFVIELTSY